MRYENEEGGRICPEGRPLLTMFVHIMALRASEIAKGAQCPLRITEMTSGDTK